MEPQRTIPMEIRRYGNATPPTCSFGGGGADRGASPAMGDAEGVVEAAAGDGFLALTRGRGLGGSL